MARNRKSESDLIVSATGAAPARRKPATTTRKKLNGAAAEAAPSVSVEVESQDIATAREAIEPAYIPAHEEIAALAYSYWEGRGFQGGSPDEDWLRAVEELRRRVPQHA